MFARLIKAWIEREYREMYRAALTGLVARGEPGSELEIARRAARQAKAAMIQLTEEPEEVH